MIPLSGPPHVRFLRPLSTAFVVVVLLAPTAVAHAAVLSAEPAPRGHAPLGLKVVEIKFTERVARDFTNVAVLDPGGLSVATGPVQFDDAHPDTIRLPVSILTSGSYVVTWRALTFDSHTATGSFTFQAGGGPAGTNAIAVSATPSSPSIAVADSVARTLLYLGLFVSCGSVFFALVIERDPTLFRRLFVAGSIFAAAGAFGGFLALALVGARTGLGLVATLRTQLGMVLLARNAMLYVAAALLLWAVVRTSTRQRVIAKAVLGLALGALVATALTGHAAAVAERPYVSVALDLAHLLMATVWIGGVFAFVLVARGRSAQELGGLVSRFTPWAMASVAILVVTGLYAAWMRIPQLSDLWMQPYGRVLALKALLVVPLLALGYYNKEKVGPALAAGHAGVRKFRRAVTVEALFMVGILVATGVLASSAPPTFSPATVQEPLPPFVDLKDATWTTHVILRLAPVPLLPGPQSLRVVLHPLTVKDIPADTRVAIKIAHGFSQAPGIERTLERTSPYDWVLPPDQLFDAPGEWRVIVHIQRPDDDRELVFPVEVRSTLPT